MKTISGGLQSHLAQTTTTLASLWRITRTDGVNFYFTDHDDNIVFDDGDGSATYIAKTGYNRTAVANDVTLAVDNMDVTGVFNSDDIKETELRAGLFDYAEVRVYIINWDDLAQGALKLRRGRFGEIVSTPQGIFRGELRGLSQQYSQNMLDNYQAECRADLGDTACKVPIDPSLLQRSTAYALGDFVKVATLAVDDEPLPVVLQVPADSDADDISPTAALATVGSEAAVQGTTTKFGAGAIEFTPTASVDPSNAFVSYPDNAAYSLGSGNFAIESWVRLKSLTETVQVFWSHYLNTGNQRGWYVARDSQRLRVVFYTDGVTVGLQMLFDFDWQINTWYHVAVTRQGTLWRVFIDGVLIGTASASITVHNSTEVLRLGKRRSAAGSDVPLNGFIDDFRLTVGQSVYVEEFDPPNAALADPVVSGTTNFQESYENTIYECTTAGTTPASAAPTYDTTPGNTTNEAVAATGTLTLTGNALDTETVVIGSKTYTFQTTLTDVDGNVQIGATATDSVNNLIAAINLDAGAGTLYATSTTIHPTVSAASGGGSTMVVTAKTPGATGNAIATTETLTNGSWGAATLLGGLDGPIFTAREAWTRNGVVATVTSNRVFTLDVAFDETRAVDDWFNYGGLKFESGPNAGKIIEIKDWVQSTRTVTLFLPAPYAIEPGVRVSLYPGCDKRSETCAAKWQIANSLNFDAPEGNILNFRGEPFVPGQDQLLSFPDAH